MYVPKFENIEDPTSDELTTNQNALAAEMAQWQQHQELINAWNELQSVPSYVEQQARAFSQEVTQ